MAMKADEIIALIKTALPDATIEIEDTVGDSDHYAITVKDPSFKNASRIQQHQTVYKALGTKMGNELHALSIKTVG